MSHQHIAIVGGGFSGLMTAVNLVQHGTANLAITIINPRETFITGVAYRPYSKRHLLNVVAGKMSAFAAEPEHFLNWLLRHPLYAHCDRTLLHNAFVPRYLFGEYLKNIWRETQTVAAQKNIQLHWVDAEAIALLPAGEQWQLTLSNGNSTTAHDVVMASGNETPRHPVAADERLLNSQRYFQNPWQAESVLGLQPKDAVLILGNGLTMVDTVIGLHEQGFSGQIYSLSPNGFNILPHRHGGLQYTALAAELPQQFSSLQALYTLVHRHIKQVRQYGLSAEPVIDSLRPHTQRIWQQLSLADKQLFMNRLRHLWGVARHRIPTHIHDFIQQLRIDQRLHIVAGKVQQLQLSEAGIQVAYHQRGFAASKQLQVSRIINCTGPETNLLRSENQLLRAAFINGFLKQDELQLGIAADAGSYRVLAGNGQPQPHLYTLGGHLRGLLWETTAVNELRTQAWQLAHTLLSAPAVAK